MKLPSTLQELHTAFTGLRKRESPGSDSICNERLTHLGNKTIVKFIEILYLSCWEDKIPQVWRDATMMPVYKKGKDRKKASSYRPISMTICAVKTGESS